MFGWTASSAETVLSLKLNCGEDVGVKGLDI